MLSNFNWFRSLSAQEKPVEPAPPLQFRNATSGELEPAVRHILASATGRVDENQVHDFIRLASAHSADLGGPWLAVCGPRIVSAAIPVVSPGRTMLLFPPQAVCGDEHAHATRHLVNAICERAAAENLTLAQTLLDTHDHSVYQLLISCKFHRLAELLYLQASLPRATKPPQLPAGLRWMTYARQSHQRFAGTVLATYENSLDCPSLNGLRHIDDILAGHKGAGGTFDPNLWFLLCDDENPLAVLLLNRVGTSDLLELVYVGIIPRHRRKGLGDHLVRHALHAAATIGCTRLSLAVDADNLPALKLYWRHGLQAIGRKLALLRDLRPSHHASRTT
jgi:ribosomal protein S18 acetylase RimI-like enzyme